MKNASVLTSFVMLLVGVFLSATAWAQDSKTNRPSPPVTASGKVGGVTVTINYSSPSVRGRQLWGELVPYGQVWRAGANEATTVAFDQDVRVEGQYLPAGKYSFYTIPGEDEWTVIFNRATGQWGTQYDASEDVLRVMATPREVASMNERLVYEITEEGIILRWGNLELPVSVEAIE